MPKWRCAGAGASRTAPAAPPPFCNYPSGQAAQSAHQLEILQTGKKRIQVRLFRHISDQALITRQILSDIFSAEEKFSARWLQQARDDLHRRALSRAVRPEISKHFAQVHFEAHVLEGRHRAIAFRERANIE